MTISFAVCCGFDNSSPRKIKDNGIAGSYKDVVCLEDKFIAITLNGRIDWISATGNILQQKETNCKNLNNLIIANKQIIASGDNGTLFYLASDNNIKKINAGTKKSINCITNFNNKIIAGYDKGELRIGNIGNSFRLIHLKLKGNIISLSSSSSLCYGLTDQGEIFHTSNEDDWTVFDFNEVYKGFYKPCSFKKVLVKSDQIAVIGINDKGSPVLFFSSKGKVWTQRPLIYTDQEGQYKNLEEIPNDIYYDYLKEQYILVGSKGILFTVPSCSHCHKKYEISDKNLYGISGNNEKVIIVGDENYLKILDVKSL